ncbi:MAG: HAMP domain-containing histidine kinase [Phycisphaerae bacterium]|nr:HAMP domain-containing histidine kinase [Phycisphaerae bacterium]
MRRSRRIAWWTAYGAGAALVALGLAWTSYRVVSLEREERLARREAERQEVLRVALRRMDTWFAPRIAREAARMWFEYEPYYPQTIAFNRLLEPIASGEVLVPSPLLGFSSDVFPVHFQWRERTGFTSPQVPDPKMIRPEMVGCGPIPVREELGQELARWATRIDPKLTLGALSAVETTLQASPEYGTAAPTPAVAGDIRTQGVPPASGQVWTNPPEPDPKREGERAVALRSKSQNRAYDVADPADVKGRVANLNEIQQVYNADNSAVPAQQQQLQQAEPIAITAVEVGPLVPLWLPGEPPALVFARRVKSGDESILQGVVVDWPRLRSDLLAQVADVVTTADLSPVPLESSDPARLVTLPAVLTADVGNVDSEATAAASPTAIGLAAVWVAVLGAIGVTGLALRSSIGNAVRTSRFASSVTHELRTPLTTFRLYSEMLAEGIVPDPQRQREYLETLRDESARLGVLVENVLAWSRVEEGRTPSEPRPLTVAALVAEITPVLERRCQEAGVSFERADDVNGSTVTTDPDRVRQILFNLVDNACKYAGRGARVALRATVGNGVLRLAIEDNGPGVPQRIRHKIFRAFDRGERGPGDSVRGLGLGLAISSELARSLGGRLRCADAPTGSGAVFALELPLGLR